VESVDKGNTGRLFGNKRIGLGYRNGVARKTRQPLDLTIHAPAIRGWQGIRQSAYGRARRPKAGNLGESAYKP
jgi:hypothetical protein